MRSFARNGVTTKGMSFSTARPSATSLRSKASHGGSTASLASLGVKPADYITKSYAELFFDWKRKTGSKAENMTFREVKKQGLGARG